MKTATPTADLPAEPPDGRQVFLGRQSILDRAQNLVAFDLLFRSSLVDSAAVSNDFIATTTVINHVLNELGLESVLGRYRGFFKVDASLMMSDIVELLPPDKVVLDILGSVEITKSIIERCRQLKALAFPLSLSDCSAVSEELKPLIPMLDFVKLGVPSPDNANVTGVIKALKTWPVKLLATKVETRGQAEVCLKLGFDLLQGYYFARPNIITGKRTPHSHAALMRLLGLVLADADNKEIEALLKVDPGLTVNLMRLVNSAATGLKRQITSSHDAIIILGRHRLRRSLQLLLYANSTNVDAFPSPLLQLVATRGRLMELLALETPMADKEFPAKAFMAGIMSLVDTLLDQPIEQALAPLNVAPDINAAILHHKGPLGKMLVLAEALDRDAMAEVSAALVEFPHINVAQLSTIQADAMSWANSLGAQALNS